MPRTVEVVDGKVRYEGRTLAEWVPDVVADLVVACDPERIILFGSVVRGDDGPDSDIDLLLVAGPTADRHAMAKAALIAVAEALPEVDPVVVGRAAIAPSSVIAGSVVAAALREGKVVYEHGGRT